MIKLRIILHLLTFIIDILLAIFIWSKGPKKKVNLFIGLTALFSGLYSLTNAIFLSRLTISWLAVCWIGLFILPPYAGLALCLRDRAPNFKNLYHMFLVGIVIFILFFTPAFSVAISYQNGVVSLNRGILDKIGRLFINYTLVYALYHLICAYRESSAVKKQQIKFFILGIGLYTSVGIVYVGILPLISSAYYDDMPGIFSSIWVAFSMYAIIRYRFIEIDTVIHRTVLWVLTSSVIFIPISAAIYLMHSWLIYLSWGQLAFLVTVIVYLYLYSYPKLQPKIDHLFRRRKYDYQTVLGMIAEKIATTVNIQDLTSQLLIEICETMYLRNGLLYVYKKDQSLYALMGRRGYEQLGGMRLPAALEIYDDDDSVAALAGKRKIKQNHPIAAWLDEHKEVLEREQIEVDPQYEDIKPEALSWFREQDLDVLVPLVVKGEVNAILGLGKKENLQPYTLKDIELLKKLGQEAGVTVFNALHYEELAEKERLDEELKLGREIQMTLLPRQIPCVPHLFLQGMMAPAKEIGGDYYDFITIPNKEELAIVIGDVSGKGVAAGILMSMVKATIHALSQEGASPKQILLRANAFLYQTIGGQKFMTLLYLKWQSQSRTLAYSSAGHEYILLCRYQSQQIETIQSGGFMLGMIPEIESFLEEKEIKLNSGDKILLYTDGVTEAENQQGERFGLPHLAEAFQRHSQKPVGELMQAVKDEVYAFIGTHPQYDDITLVVMEAT